MTDINKTILEKAAGPTRFNPDEQRRFLETYEERVIASMHLGGGKGQDIPGAVFDNPL